MRRLVLTLALLAAATPLAAQQHQHGGNALPQGWHLRLDRANPSAQPQFAAMGDGFHVTSGPAAIYWYEDHDVQGGDYTVRGTFTQTKAPTHPEAYGLILAGSNLAGDQADYMYFLVRGDGKYLIKHRAANGDIHTITDWTEHAAVHKADAQGKATNALVAEAGDWGIRFKVNGTQVAEFLTSNVPYLTTKGTAGLRINHNLDVHVSDFAVEKKP